MFFKIFIFTIVYLPELYLNRSFNLFNYKYINFGDYFKVGNFIRPLYVGTWQSTQIDQSEFVKSQNGDVILSLDYMPFNKEIKDKLIFNIEIFTQQYIEDQNMIVYTELDLVNDQQSQLTGNYDQSIQKLINKIFTLEESKKCKVQSTLNISDAEGNPLNIQTSEISNIVLKGGIVSKDCKVDFTFETHPIFLNLGPIFLFTIISIAFVILGFTPFYKAIQNEGDMSVMSLNGYFLLINILIDICIMMINVTIAMRILPYYFEFLILITFFLMISILFKFRIYLFIYEAYYQDLNLPQEQLQKQKFFLLMKTFIGIITMILLSNIFIVHYYLFLLLFLYPLFQIFYNCFYVVRKNCFKWKLHLFLILPQVMYPFALRSNLFTFFKLKSDPKFVIILISMTFIFLLILMLQRYFGRNFFLPRMCIPDYYNYLKKIKKNETYPDCPICMTNLTQKPNQEIELTQPLLNKIYMQTPCGHQFHKGCLQQWMDQKLHCPYCRTTIPPYQLIYFVNLITFICICILIFLFILTKIVIPKINNKNQFQ